jgi:Reverse transcriptase (RNA-dependent DNA polymerase)
VFLHGELTKTIFMQQPSGIVDPLKSQHGCLLKKALYELKQAPRAPLTDPTQYRAIVGAL